MGMTGSFSAVMASLATVGCTVYLPADDEVHDDCTLRGIELWGNVKIVESFPDLQIKYVDSFPGLP